MYTKKEENGMWVVRSPFGMVIAWYGRQEDATILLTHLNRS